MINLNPGNKKPSKGKGFYIALGLCICAVSLVAWNTFGPPTGNTEGFGEEFSFAEPNRGSASQPEEVFMPTENILQNIPKNTSRPEQSSAPASSQTEKEASAPAAEASSGESKPAKDKNTPLSQTLQPVVYTLPCGNTVSKPFSNGIPVRSITFNDWRIHEGTDFKADLGSEIKAVADGVVKQIFKDDMLGNVIVIDHSGGLEVHYCGVGDTMLIREGMEVTLGDTIGSVGKIPSEILEEPHLHLMIKVNGNFVDPLLALGKASN